MNPEDEQARARGEDARNDAFRAWLGLFVNAKKVTLHGFTSQDEAIAFLRRVFDIGNPPDPLSPSPRGRLLRFVRPEPAGV